MRLTYTAIWFSFITFFSCSSSTLKDELVIQLFAPDLADSQKVYIAGNTASLGYWDPDAVEMDYLGQHNWQIKVSTKNIDFIEYKFTLGSWSTENADEMGNPLSNFVWNNGALNLKQDTVQYWRTSDETIIEGQITGTVKYHKNIDYEGLLSRDIIVWLPESYATSKKNYAVLYMHDGQNIFDPKTSSFGVDWQIDETITRLIQQKSIPEIIVVGINNTSERTQEYTPGEHSDRYLAMIRDKIKPMIDSTYRTYTNREYTFIGGASYGGTISMIALWEHADLFSKALCFSPAFKTKAFDYAEHVTNSKKPSEDIWVYLDCGGVGLEKTLLPGINDMIKALGSQGYIEGQDWIYVEDLDAKHFEADWAKRFPNAVIQMTQ